MYNRWRMHQNSRQYFAYLICLNKKAGLSVYRELKIVEIFWEVNTNSFVDNKILTQTLENGGIYWSDQVRNIVILSVGNVKKRERKKHHEKYWGSELERVLLWKENTSAENNHLGCQAACTNQRQQLFQVYSTSSPSLLECMLFKVIYQHYVWKFSIIII